MPQDLGCSNVSVKWVCLKEGGGGSPKPLICCFYPNIQVKDVLMPFLQGYRNIGWFRNTDRYPYLSCSFQPTSGDKNLS